ncbi:MAG: chorismate synthase [Bdellovibrionota bacterium]
MSTSPNSFGHLFKLTSFGESHGPAIGVVIEGCPAGLKWNEEHLLDFIARRRPGASNLVSDRKEADLPEILSGVFEGKTLGTPIALLVRNSDQRSGDYAELKNNPRPGHADDMWKLKFSHTDHRGGGRSSGRETLSRVLAGAFAKTLCLEFSPQMKITSKALQVGPLKNDSVDFQKSLESLLLTAKQEGQSYGGIAEIKISGIPQGLGEPVFMKLKSELASALMSVGAVVGVELGAGFESAKREGVEFHSQQDGYGGIRGGISTGEDVVLRVAVKPTSTVLDVAKKGRHDPCILLRALVVFEAMSWLVLADQFLYKRLNQI